jgi:hypothetical protein
MQPGLKNPGFLFLQFQSAQRGEFIEWAAISASAIHKANSM